MTRLVAVWMLAMALPLGAVFIAHAQGPDVRIVQLECNSDPEVVVIENLGDAPQTLTGWELESDPSDSEVFDLSVLGSLLAGGAVSIQSGPSATGVFNWGTDEIFRDNDATDYARVVDDTGAVVHQVNCGEVAPEPSPTPSPEPSPTPTPEPSPAADVPDGGGPPPPPDDALLGGMMVLLGGFVAAAGVVTGALSWLRLRSSPVACTRATVAPGQAVARPRAHPGGPDDTHGKPASPTLGLALMGLLAAALTFLLLRRRPQ